MAQMLKGCSSKPNRSRGWLTERPISKAKIDHSVKEATPNPLSLRVRGPNS